MIKQATAWYNRTDGKVLRFYFQINFTDKIKPKLDKIFSGWRISGEGGDKSEQIIIYCTDFPSTEEFKVFAKNVPFPYDFVSSSGTTTKFNKKAKGVL